jgi:hypothetical protein
VRLGCFAAARAHRSVKPMRSPVVTMQPPPFVSES